MRIINPNQKEFNGRCLLCSADIAICRVDLHFGLFRTYIICPVCHRKLTISDEALEDVFGYNVLDDDI